MPSQYPVILIVTSAEGCTDTVMAQFIIEEIYSLFIPSGFTPNDDGINPIFFAYGSGLTEFHMEIFNRWGESVYISNDIMKGWNGELRNGNLAQQGVYDYKIDVTFTNNKTNTVMGKITLIR